MCIHGGTREHHPQVASLRNPENRDLRNGRVGNKACCRVGLPSLDTNVLQNITQANGESSTLQLLLFFHIEICCLKFPFDALTQDTYPRCESIKFSRMHLT